MGLEPRSLAQPMPKQTGQAEYLVGVEDVSYYPYFDFNNPQDQGYLKTLLEEFADDKGLRFTYVPLPISRFDMWYELDRIDFRLPDNPRWHLERDKSLIFSEPVVQLSTATVVLEQNRQMAYNDFKTIGILSGFTPSEHWFQKRETGQLAILDDSSMAILYRMLKSNMVDGLDIAMPVVKHQEVRLGHSPSALSVAENVPKQFTVYSMSTISHPDVIQAFNEYLLQHRDRVAALQRQYGVQ